MSYCNIVSHSSLNLNNNLDPLDPLEARHLWIQNCDYHNGCGYNGKWSCNNQFCRKHGLAQRIDLQERVLARGRPQHNPYFIVLKFECLVPPSVVKSAREHWLYLMRKEFTPLEYLWRQHFLNKEAH